MTYLVIATLRGTLGSIDGTMILDEGNPSHSSVTASIDIAAVNTGMRLRDAHLRSGEFFDAARFPKVTFQSTYVEKIAADNFRTVGDLTIRDITQEVVLDTSYEGQTVDSDGSRRARFAATTILSRRAFKLGRRTPIETAGTIASNEVQVRLDISAVAA